MRRVPEARMQKYWDERARLNAAWYVDTSLDFDAPDMDRFFDDGQRIVAHVLERLPAAWPRGGVALEIGSGLGRLCRALTGSFDHVIGLDISPEMVERATALVPGCEFRVNDGSSLEGVEDESVRFVLTFTVFQHIPDPRVIQAYVREIGRVLQPGGCAYLQWNGSGGRFRWSVRRRLLTLARRIRLRPTGCGTEAPEFQGSCIKPSVMTRWLEESGLSIVATDALGGLWAQAWVVKDGEGG